MPSILTSEKLGHHVKGDNVHVDLHHTCRLDQSLNSCIRHSTGMLWITGDPARDGLHADRRYQALIHSVAQSLAS